jgi:ATP-binding protein involved in chromosome partitioning
LTGVLIVTTPQDVALQDVRRSISMFEKVKVPILGVVENMSTFICPHCGKPTDIFSKGGGAKAAEQLKIPFLGEIPLISEVRVGSDTGHPIVLTHPDSPAAAALTEAAKKLAAQVSILAVEEAEKSKAVWKV